jgi:hypothetical protein
MLHFLFDVFVGQYAPILSGALGISGSIALAVPPISSGDLRLVQLQLDEIEGKIPPISHRDVKREVVREARKLLTREKYWNFVGAALLFLAFAVLLANGTYCGLAGPGACH